jgi:CRP-like cAMP-binding protein
MVMDVLKQIEIFRGLDQLHLAHLASIAERLELSKGTVLFEEGDQGKELYVIESGKVRVSKMVPNLGEEALAILPPGTYFGEMEFLERDLRRAARVIIHEDAVLFAFRYSDLDDLLGADLDLALAIYLTMLRTFSRRLRDTNDKIGAMFAMALFGSSQ